MSTGTRSLRFVLPAVAAIAVSAGCSTESESAATSRDAINGTPLDGLLDELARADAGAFEPTRYDVEPASGGDVRQTRFDWERGDGKISVVNERVSTREIDGERVPVDAVSTIDGASSQSATTREEWRAWVSKSVRERYRWRLYADYIAAPLTAFAGTDDYDHGRTCAANEPFGLDSSGIFVWTPPRGQPLLVCEYDRTRVVIVHPSGVKILLVKDDEGKLTLRGLY